MDTVLIISMAMIFMTVIQKSGALEALNAVIVSPLPQGPGGHADSADAHHHVPGHDHGLLHRRGAFRRRYRGPHPADDGHPGPQTGAILAVGAIMGMAAPW